jgi:sec-independent protein translocase protein TatA
MLPTLAVFGLGGTELLVVLLAVLILFGARKIPDFAKGLGQGIKEFRKASREVQEELERATEEVNNPPPPVSRRAVETTLATPEAAGAEGPSDEVEQPASSSTAPKA